MITFLIVLVTIYLGLTIFWITFNVADYTSGFGLSLFDESRAKALRNLAMTPIWPYVAYKSVRAWSKENDFCRELKEDWRRGKVD